MQKTEGKSLHLGSASKTDKFKTHGSINTFSNVQSLNVHGEIQRPLHPLRANCLETLFGPNHSVGPRKLIQPCSASFQRTDSEKQCFFDSQPCPNALQSSDSLEKQ